jgi:hypothetical protein
MMPPQPSLALYFSEDLRVLTEHPPRTLSPAPVEPNTQHQGVVTLASGANLFQIGGADVGLVLSTTAPPEAIVVRAVKVAGCASAV